VSGLSLCLVSPVDQRACNSKSRLVITTANIHPTARGYPKPEEVCPRSTIVIFSSVGAKRQSSCWLITIVVVVVSSRTSLLLTSASSTPPSLSENITSTLHEHEKNSHTLRPLASRRLHVACSLARSYSTMDGPITRLPSLARPLKSYNTISKRHQPPLRDSPHPSQISSAARPRALITVQPVRSTTVPTRHRRS